MSTTRHKASAQASAPPADDRRRLSRAAKAAKTCLTGLCAAWIVLLAAFAVSPVVVAQSLPNAVPAFAAERASITTTLTSSTNPVVVGGSSVLTATVSRGNPNASVTFMNGATPLGTVSVSGNGNTRTASFTASFTTAGVQSLTAVYQANTGNASSTTAALAQTVNPASSSTALSATPNPATVGQAITLTANVSGYNPSGTVTFKDGATTLGTGTLSAGVASFTTSTLATGSHSITAVYAGDTINTASTSGAVAQTVNPASSTTVLSATPNPTTVGQAITLSANVGGYNPSGTVTFKDGATTLGTGTVSGGTA
ncbi:MAG: Ig-like domain-containing protein, partial [Burkholderiaceae bacterium]|nr:Ig-like domain-containing protein [Burkholderiaceae bacterium]